MSKTRVYLVAKELGMDNKSLVALFNSLGVTEVRNHMSAVGAEQIDRVKRHLSKQSSDKAPGERVRARGGSGSVIIRRGRRKPSESAGAKEPSSPSAAPVPSRRAPPADPVREASPPPAASAAAPSPASAPAAAAPSLASAPAAAAPSPASAPAAAAPSLASAPAVAAPAGPAAAAAARASSAPPAAEKGVPAVAPKPPPVPSPAAPSAEQSPPAAASSVSAPAQAPDVQPSSDVKPAVAKPVSKVTPPPAAALAGAAPSGASPAGASSAAAPAAAPPAGAQGTAPTAPAVPAKASSAAAQGTAPAASTAPAKVSSAAAPPKASPAAAAPTVAAPTVAAGAPPASAPPARSQAPAAATAAAEPPAARAPAAPRPPEATRSRMPAPAGPAAAAAAAAAARRASGQPAPPPRTSQPKRTETVSKAPAKTGIDVWQGRPGVPMPQPPRSGIPQRRVQYDAKVGGGGPRRGPMMGGRRGPGPRRGIGSMRGRSLGGGGPVTQERSAHKKVVKIEGSIALQALAGKLGIKAGQLLMKLMSLGMTGININSTLDSDTAKIVGEEFGWTVSDVAVSEDDQIAAAQGEAGSEVDEERIPRPPIVTVMGHVDHGKTSLLDRIRAATVAGGEAGGITQHIGAYSVGTPRGRIAFLDTPGHAAFTAMRARGVKCTDIVVLVVAADDGVMPQTKEAVSHAKDAGCPIVVAVNKIDKEDAQPERVRRELAELNLVPEEWGGDTLFCEVSAVSGQGVDALLDTIVLQGEMLDLRANPTRAARGTVIEAKLDRGQGPVATVLITDGTLKKGEGVLVGSSWGRVRAMLDENGKNVSEAGPSTPVEVIGLSDVPSAGDIVNSVADAKKAQQIAESRRTKQRSALSTNAKISMEEVARRMSQSEQEELKLIIKADVQGSIEALTTALEQLSTDKVRVTIVHSAVGAITEGDINLSVAAEAIVVGFNVRPAGKASNLAQREGVEIRQYSVIYDVLDDAKKTMEGLLAPTLVEEKIGEAEVRKIFKVTKAGVVAGCMVISGVVRRNALVKLHRESNLVWEGKLDSLKRFKDDAKEVREGYDCGISFQGFSELQEGDVIAAFEQKEVRPTL